jgi:hypothetical protein
MITGPGFIVFRMFICSSYELSNLPVKSLLFPLFDQLPARWADSALPEQVAEDAKDTSPNSPPIAALPLPFTVLLRAAPPCLIMPGASLRPAIAAARLAIVCGFALGGALRAFFVVA